MKIIKWIIAFVPTLIGIVQAAIKFIKELLTLVVDVLFPIIPIGKFKAFVTWLRAAVDTFDTWFQKIKDAILKWIGLL